MGSGYVIVLYWVCVLGLLIGLLVWCECMV